MKTIIAGSRDIGWLQVKEAMAACPWADEITEVVSGKARGADTYGEEWAHSKGIEVEPFPADWTRYGKSAGYRRNAEMAVYGEALVAIWDLESDGTRNMIALAQQHGIKRIFVWSPGIGEVKQTADGWVAV